MSSERTKEFRERLEVLPIGELRKQAVQAYGLKLNKDYTKENIIDLIISQFAKHDFAHVGSDDVPAPGWSRIKVSPIPGNSNFPFHVHIMGYSCFIPFNQVVDVPTKVLNVLDTALETRYRQDAGGEIESSEEPSYTYSLILTTPGPDPRPGLEVNREKKVKAKREFAEKYGFWPKDSDLREQKHVDALEKLRA